MRVVHQFHPLTSRNFSIVGISVVSAALKIRSNQGNSSGCSEIGRHSVPEGAGCIHGGCRNGTGAFAELAQVATQRSTLLRSPRTAGELHNEKGGSNVDSPSIGVLVDGSEWAIEPGTFLTAAKPVSFAWIPGSSLVGCVSMASRKDGNGLGRELLSRPLLSLSCGRAATAGSRHLAGLSAGSRASHGSSTCKFHVARSPGRGTAVSAEAYPDASRGSRLCNSG